MEISIEANSVPLRVSNAGFLDACRALTLVKEILDQLSIVNASAEGGWLESEASRFSEIIICSCLIWSRRLAASMLLNYLPEMISSGFKIFVLIKTCTGWR